MYLHRLIGVGIHRYRDGDAMTKEEWIETGWCDSQNVSRETKREVIVKRNDITYHFPVAVDSNWLPQANYPMPATIGYVAGKYGTYQIDTRRRFDGMPLFRGYTWDTWNRWSR